MDYKFLHKDKKGRCRFLPKDKKGAEMTISTIITIVLGLALLVVLILGFTSGWSNLWDRIIGIGGGGDNVQTIVQSCELACTTNAQYDWCSKVRNVKYKNSIGKDKIYKMDSTCVTLDNNLKDVNAGSVSLSCSSITCPE
jgi:hypothetical protein